MEMHHGDALPMDTSYEWTHFEDDPLHPRYTWFADIVGHAISRIEATRNHTLDLVRIRLEVAADPQAADPLEEAEAADPQAADPLEEAADRSMSFYDEVNLRWRCRSVFRLMHRFHFNKPPRPLPLIQLLCSFGLQPTIVLQIIDADQFDLTGSTNPIVQATVEVREWLNSAYDWTTPLHYASLPHCFPEGRAEALLAAGADPHASVQGGRSPLELAVATMLHLTNASQVVIDAAGPWSSRTHHLFPAALRAQAISYIGPLYQIHAQYIDQYKLSTDEPTGLGTGGISSVDFNSLVLAFAIIRMN